MKIQVSARSIFELGQRSNQEDYIYPALSDRPQTGDLFILCDGMGGHEKGEVASQTVCETMRSYIGQHARPDNAFDENDFRQALSAAYDALDAKDTGSEKKMGTTLTFVKFHKDGCFLAHIGDSRIYHIRPATKSILHKTRDHSLVNDLITLGELTPEEARTSNQKNIITRAMQPNQERRAQADCTNLTDLQAGDYIYMCSDGMLEISEDSEIVNILSMDRSDANKIEILKGATQENHDNHSAHLIRIVSVDTSAEKPVAATASPEAAPSAPARRPAPATPAVPATPVAPVAPAAPVRRRSPFRRIIPVILGLVVLGGLTYAVVCILNNKKQVLEEPITEQQSDRVVQQPATPVMTPAQNHDVVQHQEVEQPEVVPNASTTVPPAQDLSQEQAQLPSEAPAANPAEETAPEADVVAEYGTLVLESIPNGASIYIDGKDTGEKTPHSFTNMEHRAYSVELKMEGYESSRREVELQGRIKKEKWILKINNLDNE